MFKCVFILTYIWIILSCFLLDIVSVGYLMTKFRQYCMNLCSKEEDSGLWQQKGWLQRKLESSSARRFYLWPYLVFPLRNYIELVIISHAHTLFIITQFSLILPFEMITAVNEMSLKKNHALYIIKYVAILFNTFHWLP